MQTKRGFWIWNSEAAQKNAYVDFVRDFELNDISDSAQLFIGADTEYALWINGSFVSCGQYRDYPGYLRYDSLNVAKYLVKGKNRIAIKVYYQGEESMQYAKYAPGLFFELCCGDVTIKSDNNTLTAIANEYMSGEMFKTTMQLGYGFEYDARRERDLSGSVEDFTFANQMEEIELLPRPVEKLIHSNKENVKIITQGYFKREEGSQTIAQAMQKDFLSNRSFDDVFEGKPYLPGKIEAKENKDLYFLIDFQEERGGYLYFDIDTDDGANIDISYGEHLDDLRVRCDINGRNFANRCIARSGRNNFTYYFRRIAGRYMQIHISDFSHLTIYDAGIIRTDYPLEHCGKFICTDSLHNKIHDICKETMVNCIHEHYEDTPWREQGLYASDSRNQMLFGYYTFSEHKMARTSLELLARGMRDDGYISVCAPTDINLSLPSFSFIWFLEMKEYILYSGDASLAEKLWQQMEFMMETYTSNMKDDLYVRPYGVRYWHYYEWSEGNYFNDPFSEPAPKEFEDNLRDGLYNAFLAMGIDCALWIGRKLSKTQFVEKYEKILCNLKSAVNKYFWNEEHSLYCGCTQYGEQKNYGELMQSIAIVTNIADEKRAQLLRKALTKKDSSLVKITLSYTLYKYEALLRDGDEYIGYVLDDIKGQWGKMAFSGAVSAWELDIDDKDFGKAGSYCHAWSSVPIYVYYRYVLGITPEFMRGETSIAVPYNTISAEGQVKTLKGVCEVGKND